MVACIACSETALASTPRSPNGFLSALATDDFELIRPYLRTADLIQESTLAEAGTALPRAYFPHCGLISLVTSLSKGEHVQVGMIGRDSIYGAYAALGDPIALNGAVVQIGGAASAVDLERCRGRPQREVSRIAGAPRTRTLCAGPADRRLQRGASGGSAAGTLPAANP